jgi:type I restriction enzyme, R subunit
VKQFIIPDIVLFVNGIPLVVVEAKIGDANTANPMHAAFEQLLRYRNGAPRRRAAGLREGEPRLFYTNLLLMRTCGEKADFGTITSGTSTSMPGRTSGPRATGLRAAAGRASANRSG